MPTKAETNGVAMLNSIRQAIIGQSNELNFADRIPLATQANIKEFGASLMEYEPAINAFVNELVNRIGYTYITRKNMTNTLKFLKKGKLDFGDTIQDIMVDIAKAHTFASAPKTGEECDVFAVNKPDVKVAYYSVNREDQYPITINEDMLKMAFMSYDKLSRFVSSILDSVYNADEVDEFILFKNLIGKTLSNSYLVKVDKPIDRNTAEAFSEKMRTYSYAMSFPSRKYNRAGVATRTNLEEQLLIMRSDIAPVIDVRQLANNFQLNYGKPLAGRIVLVDDFGDFNNILGGLIDKDFAMIYDVTYKMTSQYNAKHLYWNYFLTHRQVIASSFYANAVGFTTEDVVFAINSINIEPKEQSIRKGYNGSVDVVVDFTGQGDTSYTLSISGNASNATKIAQDGKIFIGADETASAITITATSTAKFGTSEPKPVTGTASVKVKN